MSFSLLNAQSIKNKENELSQYLHETKTDICIITKIWLKPCDEDTVWCSRSELNSHWYRIRSSPHTHQRGEGLAIIYKSHFQVNLIEEGKTRSFQFAKWQIKLNSSNNQVIFIVIYHPPHSLANLTTTTQLLDDFTNWLPDQFLQMNTKIILGCFNIHVNKIDSGKNANIFMETAEALGLHQHVQFGKHKCGNNVGLISTEAGSSITIRSCNQGLTYLITV